MTTQAVKPDHTFRLTRWRIVNLAFIIFLVIVAWRPLWEKIACLAHAVGTVFDPASK